MSLAIDSWIPKFIRQDVDYRAGQKVTSERMNELLNLIIDQTDYNSLTLQLLMANFGQFDVEYLGLLEHNEQYHDSMLAAFNNAIAQIESDNARTYSEITSQLSDMIGDAIYGFATEQYVNNTISGVTSSLIEQTASMITLQVTDILEQYSTTAETRSLIQQTADAISLSVSQEVSVLDNKISAASAAITISANNIRSEVTQLLTEYPKSTQVTSAISQSAGAITAQITEQINGVTTNMSTLQQTVNGFMTSVQNDVNGMYNSVSIMQQTANKISWLVKSGTNASNFILTDRVIQMISDEIDITGYVTIRSLSDPDNFTLIDGGRIQGTEIIATIGTIGGFDFTDNGIRAGFYYNNGGKFFRISPLSSYTGEGSNDIRFASIDLGTVEPNGRVSTNVHLRNDGYARFGHYNRDTEDYSVRINDYLRYRASEGEEGTETVLYTQNFQIGTDGKVHIKSEDVPKAIAEMVATKDANGSITKLALTFTDGTSADLDVQYTPDGSISKIGNTVVSY